MSDLLPIVKLREPSLSSSSFGIPSKQIEELEGKLNLEFCGEFRSYLEKSIPHQSKGWGYIDFLSPEDLQGWNLEAEASKFFHSIGFITFAHNSGPSFFCVDNHWGRVLEMGHSICGWSDFRVYDADFVSLSQNRYSAYILAAQFWPSFGGFFEWLGGQFLLGDTM